jgi:clan AA aspartic protease
VVDTGFTEFLTLPADVVARLGLIYEATTQLVMADGRPIRTDVYGATVIWDGVEREIRVQEGGDESLVGMSLLHGFRVTLDVVDGGAMTIVPLP